MGFDPTTSTSNHSCGKRMCDLSQSSFARSKDYNTSVAILIRIISFRIIKMHKSTLIQNETKALLLK